MKASVIVSVYNNFEWLKHVLEALSLQSVKDFEIVIADDGSNESIKEKISKFIENHKELDIKYFWHQDRGWRKNIALNGAVVKSSGEYLIFIDGDCIPHPRFVEDHLNLATRKAVVAGRRADLPKKISEELENMEPLPTDYDRKIKKEILTGVGKSFGENFKVLKRLTRLPLALVKLLEGRDGGILGCNFSLFRKDFMAVNGFDERYLAAGTGEDTDIEWRLRHNGIKIKKVARAALMYHRYHERMPMDSPENKILLETALKERIIRTPFGIEK